eukprot:CAMPEP_0172453508 /NCGR_PEP_ID=MMETSP1065-20121228/10793_1 /TAXON_ID=265537 /ORGANISM="Amphiprora paludosa, Strain CCMP125" /LENGTH=359 /DNA_ID=CAMNT_0013205691 /DNA_START=172 /DNA_END=1251 /DNA_ORIENTATION=+
MMRSSLDQLNSSDLSAILSGGNANNNTNNNNGNASSVANLLLGQGQGGAPNLASLTAALSAAAANNAPAPAPTTNTQSQTTALLTALLQQQQREDQKKAALWSQLAALNNPPAPSPADNLAAILQAKQVALPSSNGSSNPLAALLGGNPISGASPNTNLFGGPTHGGQLDAVAMAKLLQSQQAPAAPAPPTNQASALAAHMGGASATDAILDSATALSMSADRRRKGRTGTFPQKLHQMLSDLERQDGGTDIASFLPHGRAFAIHKPRDFVKHVMPKYFRMSRFSSFQRQLNLYDFQRITEGPDKGSYYHELFVQGRPILSTMMKRNKIKGVKALKQQQEEKNASLEEDEDLPEGDEEE